MLKNEKDFYAGLLFIVLGLAFAIGAQSYDFGNSLNPGPGFLPFVAGVVLALLGGAILVNSLRGDARSEGQLKIGNLRPLFWVTFANVLLGACIGGLNWGNIHIMEPLGLVLGIYVLVFVASRAEPSFKLREVFWLATGLSVFSYLVFIKGLGLVLPVWPDFLGLH